MPIQITCPTCQGTGQYNGNECHVCLGTGTIEATGTHTVVEAYMINTNDRLVALQAKVDDLEVTIGDILDKCNDIFEKVNT